MPRQSSEAQGEWAVHPTLGEGSRSALSRVLGIERRAKVDPHADALAAPGRKPLSYGSLWRQLHSTHRALAAAGIQPDEVVAVALPNGCELVLLALAIADLAACALLDPALPEAELRWSLSRLKARTLMVAERDSAPAARAATSLGMQVIRMRVRTDEPAGVFTLRGPETPAPASFGRRTRAAFLVFTSATTGTPKIVPKNAEQLRASSFCSAPAVGLGAQDRLLVLLPLHQGHSLTATYGQLLAGGTVIYPGGFDDAEFPSWLRDCQPTWYTGSAPVHHAVLTVASKNPGLFQEHPLRLVRSTGPIADASLLERLEQVLGAPVLDGYGTTEAGAITRNTAEDRKTGSVGRAVRLEVAIMDESGNLLPPGQEGEVVVRGPSVMTEYLDDPEATRAAFRRGWYCTGDLGRLDAEGFLFLSGRLKDYINRGGQKILPLEVDQALTAHPDVADAACFPLPHRTLGEDVAAAVVARNGNLSEETLRRFVAQRVAPFKVPRRIFFVRELPRTANGKVKRADLASQFREGGAAAHPTASPPGDALEQKLAAIWEQVLETSPVGPAGDFFALGGDSLSATIMLHRVQEALCPNEDLLARTDFFDEPTVAGLARILRDCGWGSPPAGGGSLHGARILGFHRDGWRKPLLCFPAVVQGQPFYLRHLAKALGPDQPFYVLVPPNAVENGRLLRIQEVARRSVEALRQVAPRGPYAIAGHCYGGVLAWEAACQLVAAGERVETLLLFDAPAPGYPKVLRHWKRYLRELARLPSTRESVRHVRCLLRLSLNACGGRVVRAARPFLRRSWHANRKVRGLTMGEYKPGGLSIPIAHFIAADQPVSTRVLDDPRQGWSEWARGGLEARLVRGDHFSMFAPENAAELAAGVERALPTVARASACGAGG